MNEFAELVNSQVLDYGNLQKSQTAYENSFSKDQTELLSPNVETQPQSPLKVISEDNGSSVTMAALNLAARKSSALQSGTQNLSDANLQSLGLNEIAENSKASPSQIVIVKPPGIHLKKVASQFTDMQVNTEKVALSSKQSDMNFKQDGGKTDMMDRINSLKGISKKNYN